MNRNIGLYSHSRSRRPLLILQGVVVVRSYAMILLLADYFCFNSYCVWGVPRGEGGTLIFSFIRRLGPFFVFKILNFNIFEGFHKNEYFLWYEDFVDIGLVMTKLDYFGGHFYAFGGLS